MFGITSLIVLGGASSVLWLPGSGRKIAKAFNWIKANHRKYMGPVVDRFYGERPPLIRIKRVNSHNDDKITFEFSSIKIIKTQKEAEEVIYVEEEKRKSARNLVLNSSTKDEFLEKKGAYANIRERTEEEFNRRPINYNTLPSYKLFLTVPKGICMGEIDFTNWQTQEGFELHVFNESAQSTGEVSSEELCGILNTLQKIPLTLGQEGFLFYPDQKVEDITQEVFFNTGLKILDWSGNTAVEFLDYILDQTGVVERRFREGTIAPDQGLNANLQRHNFVNHLIVLVNSCPKEKAQEILDHYYDVLIYEIDNDLEFIRKGITETKHDLKSIQDTQTAFQMRLKFFGKTILVGGVCGVIAIGAALYFVPLIGGILSGSVVSGLFTVRSYIGSWIAGISCSDIFGIIGLGGLIASLTKIKLEFLSENAQAGQDKIKLYEKGKKHFKYLKKLINDKKLATKHVLERMHKLLISNTEETLDFGEKNLSLLDLEIIQKFLVKKALAQEKCSSVVLDLHDCNIYSNDINGLISKLMQYGNNIIIKKIDLSGNYISRREEEIFLNALEETNFTITELKVDFGENSESVGRINKQLLMNRYLQGEEFSRFNEHERNLFTNNEAEIKSAIISKLQRSKLTELPIVVNNQDSEWVSKVYRLLSYKKKILTFKILNPHLNFEDHKNFEIFIDIFREDCGLKYFHEFVTINNLKLIKDYFRENLRLLSDLNQKECARLIYVLFCNGKTNDSVALSAEIIANFILDNPKQYTIDIIKQILKELSEIRDSQRDLSDILMTKITMRIKVAQKARDDDNSEKLRLKKEFGSYSRYVNTRPPISKQNQDEYLFAEKAEQIVQKTLKSQLLRKCAFLENYLQSQASVTNEELSQIDKFFEKELILRDLEFVASFPEGEVKARIEYYILRNNMLYWVNNKSAPELIGVIKKISLARIENILHAGVIDQNFAKQFIDLLFIAENELRVLDDQLIFKVISIGLRLTGKESEEATAIARVITDLIKIGYVKNLGGHAITFGELLNGLANSWSQNRDKRLTPILEGAVFEDLRMRHPCLKGGQAGFENLKTELEKNRSLIKFEFGNYPIADNIKLYVNSVLTRNRIELILSGRALILSGEEAIKLQPQDIPQLKEILSSKRITKLSNTNLILEKISESEIREINNIITKNKETMQKCDIDEAKLKASYESQLRYQQ